jgi:hypothetical protein
MGPVLDVQSVSCFAFLGVNLLILSLNLLRRRRTNNGCMASAAWTCPGSTGHAAIVVALTMQPSLFALVAAVADV